MRRLAALLMVGVFSGCAMLPKLHVGVGLSAVVPDEDALETTIQGDVCAKVTVAMLQVEASVGMRTYDYTVDTGTIVEGELEQMPVAIVAKYAVGAGAAVFLVGGGLVWNVNDTEEIQTLTVDDSLGYKAVIGVDINLPKGFGLNVEAQYDFNEADLEGVLAGEDVDTSGLIARMAILYHF